MGVRWAGASILFLVSLTGRLSAQEDVPWHDPSPHTVQFVTVGDDVTLEVLDWGGSGRPVVLLAGQGDTAHVFDNFAPKLTPQYHIYGITRRGYGESSIPENGYSADRLGDDVLEVLATLKLERPVLVGHSIAGEELSSIGTRYPERVAGLIYLEGGYSYAYYDRSVGNYLVDLRELRENLEQLQPGKGPPDLREMAEKLLRENLPEFENDLRELEEDLQAPPVSSPRPTADDTVSFKALHDWVLRVRGLNYPEAELHETFETRRDGGVNFNRLRYPGRVTIAILGGEQKYTDIRIPVLSIYAVPHNLGPFADHNPRVRAAYEARDLATTEAQAKAFERGVRSARVVRIPHANHLIFLSNEADVLREVRAFLTGLH
jgi:pimeloyl-ACP methyl ester carboxylesterase